MTTPASTGGRLTTLATQSALWTQLLTLHPTLHAQPSPHSNPYQLDPRTLPHPDLRKIYLLRTLPTEELAALKAKDAEKNFGLLGTILRSSEALVELIRREEIASPKFSRSTKNVPVKPSWKSAGTRKKNVVYSEEELDSIWQEMEDEEMERIEEMEKNWALFEDARRDQQIEEAERAEKEMQGPEDVWLELQLEEEAIIQGYEDALLEQSMEERMEEEMQEFEDFWHQQRIEEEEREKELFDEWELSERRILWRF